MKRIVTVLLAAIMLFSGLQIAMAEEITEAVASEESLAQELVAETPAEAPTAEEPAVAEPAAEEPEAPAAEEPAEKQAAEEPAAEEPEAKKQAEEAAAEKPAEKEPAATAAAEEPTIGEPEEAKATEETAPAFTGTLSTTGSKVAETGSEAYVEAIVSGANMGYSVYWEQEFPELLELQGPEAVWKRIENADGEQYRFTVAQTSGSYSLRAVLCAEDGTILTSNITVEVQEPASVEQPEEEAKAEEPAGEELTEEKLAGEEPTPEAADENTEIVKQEKADAEGTEIIEDYETPLGISGITVFPEYEYERDENGELVLDEKGNPVVVRENLTEDDEIPVAFLRDESGALVLTEKGNPIPVQTVPYDAVKIMTLGDALDPDRYIDIYSSWDNEEPAFGGKVHFVAALYGYDKVEYNIQWQQSQDNAVWTDVSGADSLHYYSTITEENYTDYWRVKLTITGISENI